MHVFSREDLDIAKGELGLKTPGSDMSVFDEFVASPHSQVTANSVVYSSVSGLGSNSFK